VAGIGFALRDLMRRGGLWGVVEAQLHGVVVVAGPWLFSVVAMALPTLLLDPADAAGATPTFVTLLLYVFSSSLALTGPLAIGLTRHVADLLYAGRERDLARAFVGALLLALALGLPVVALGARWLALPRPLLVQAALAYGLVTMSWIITPMLSTLRAFRLLTGAWGLGTLAFACWLLARPDADAASLLAGFNLGMGLTDALLAGLLLRGFPGPAEPLLDLLGTLRRSPALVAGGLCHGLGIWIDKWLMWGAPERERIADALPAYPTYDTAAFLAYLTTVPALALFVVRAETAIADRASALYRAIARHASLAQLEQARAALIAGFLAAARDVLVLQAIVTGLVLALPVVLLDAFGVPHVGVFMFRFLALGAALQSGAMMLVIVLHYSDSARAALAVHATFLVASAGLTLLTLRAGLPTYGMGFLGASLLAFVLAWWLVVRSLRALLFLAFVRQNTAVRDAPEVAAPAWQRFDAVTGPGPLDRQG
jgi:uncharacterized membrane protein